MSRSRHVDTITDFLIVAISPALVMLMVGSLVFFAINCFYVGSFDGRLYIATALFVFAAVLVSRISIDEGREYASMFAIPLSIMTILSIMRYTDTSLLFLLPMVAFIWWSTDKLTWDCTVIDTTKDASGQGLLQTIGVDGEGAESNEDEHAHAHEFLDAEATTNKEETDRKSIWQRWKDHRHRNHTPGVWVIYFGIAAIPIFGLGQLLLTAHQRGPAFLLLCIYVASALALLMTTSFLQMRRYLNQRQLPFTDQMAGVWLSTGGVLIVGLMLLCLFLPRPNTGYSLVDSLGSIGSKDQNASKYSFGKQDAVQDEQQDDDGESDKEQATSDSENGRQTSQDAKKGKKPGDDAKTKGNKKSDSAESDSGESKEPSEANNGDDADDADEQPKSSDRQNTERSSEDGTSDKQDNDKQSSESEDTESQSNEDDTSKENASKPSNFKFEPRKLPDFIPDVSLPSIPKLVYFVIIGAIVLFVFLRYGRQIGVAINAFLRDLAEMLRMLFGGKRRSRSDVEQTAEVAETTEPMRPFSSYPNPFSMGTAEQYTPQQLVNYTFEALQAWASERNCGRSEEQTPLEFAANIATSHKQVGPSAKSLAELYNRVAYAPGTIGTDAVEQVQRLWKALGPGKR